MTTKLFLLFFSILTLSTCEVSEKSTSSEITKDTTIVSRIAFDHKNHLKKYKQLIKSIPQLKKAINQNNPTEKLAQGKELFTHLLVDSIFNYWYGTKWDFNGHTKTPRNGEIACGYFITTTLKDLGIRLNRIKLAQQASSEIIKKLCKPSTIQMYSNLDQLKSYLAPLKDNEILILGLDYHVGFVVKRDGKNYFIHSNYIDREGVIKEELATSLAIRSSNIYMIGNISRNDSLILDWLNQ